jgi:hypothetical protein
VQELESDKLRDTGEIVKRGETNENLREEDERVGEDYSRLSNSRKILRE